MRRNLVRALLVAERWDQVVMQANRGAGRDTGRCRTAFARGTALNALGQHTRACAAFARALSLQPNHAASWLNMGNASADLDDIATAEALYRTAISLDPALAEAHASLGHLLGMQGRLAEAIGACEAAIACGRTSPRRTGTWRSRRCWAAICRAGLLATSGAGSIRDIGRICRHCPAGDGMGRRAPARRSWCGRAGIWRRDPVRAVSAADPRGGG